MTEAETLTRRALSLMSPIDFVFEVFFDALELLEVLLLFEALGLKLFFLMLRYNVERLINSLINLRLKVLDSEVWTTVHNELLGVVLGGRGELLIRAVDFRVQAFDLSLYLLLPLLNPNPLLDILNVIQYLLLDELAGVLPGHHHLIVVRYF